jgi:hypothetical protein
LQPNTSENQAPGKFVNPAKSIDTSRETLQAVVDLTRNSFFSNPDKSSQDILKVDTSVLANNLNSLVNFNLKNFAAALRVNKTYLAGLLKAPVAWEQATKLQRFIFLAVKNVLKQRSSGMESLMPTSSSVTSTLTSTATSSWSAR